MLLTLESSATTLIDANQKPVDPRGLAGLIILVNFWSVTCPSCVQTDAELREVHKKFPGVVMVAVLSNQNEDPTEAERVYKERGYDRLWIDPGAEFARASGAITTPTAMIFDQKGALRYRGAINDKTFRKRIPEVNFIQNAFSQLTTGSTIDPSETPAYGCAINSFSMDE